MRRTPSGRIAQSPGADGEAQRDRGVREESHAARRTPRAPASRRLMIERGSSRERRTSKCPTNLKEVKPKAGTIRDVAKAWPRGNEERTQRRAETDRRRERSPEVHRSRHPRSASRLALFDSPATNQGERGRIGPTKINRAADVQVRRQRTRGPGWCRDARAATRRREQTCEGQRRRFGTP